MCNVKALIVDDCQLTREMIGFFIAPFAETDYAGDGAEAVKMFSEAVAAESGYDLICLDITMPVMGGHEALGRIRGVEACSAKGRSKIFMITASSSPDDMIAAITDGECDDYLTKPVIGKAFIELMRKHGLVS